MEYIRPEIICIKSAELNTFIHAHAESDGGCGAIGCPKPRDYQSGAGCGHAYDIGACDIMHNT